MGSRRIRAIFERHGVLPYLLIALLVLIWLAPMTLLGRMPVGGDVTSFFMPLMGYYRQSLLAGRIPIWNELWGYGFPMLAESQAGVFYPPHLVLFWLFETETAYSVSLVLHFVLAGWSMVICARQFGLSRWGSTLAAVVFVGNGFFIIHFPHQWSYTAGCWMPLAVGMAWRIVRAGGDSTADRAARTASVQRRVRTALGLSGVLAVQLLAGHFQLAFYTQVMVLFIGLYGTMHGAIRWWRERRPAANLARGRGALARWAGPLSLAWVALPVGIAFLLAAVQLLPTRELIAMATPDGRDFDYLSGFAQSPFHLVSYLVPTLFHVNPLWRPVAWDPWHTSPEECFSYVGLLPLCLAMGAGWRWRHEPGVRLCVLGVAVTLILSFGPYQPFFRMLIWLPGFDGFRSSSRWSLGTALFLGLLAGRALDGLWAPRRLRYWWWRLCVVALLAGGLCFGAAWMLVHGAGSNSVGTIVRWAGRVWTAVNPWNESGAIERAVQAARRPPSDPWAVPGLARIGYRVVPKGIEATAPGPRELAVRSFTLAGEFGSVAMQELLPPALIFAAIAGCVLSIPVRRRIPPWVVLGIVSIELGAAGWLRPVEFMPRGRLVDSSPVLAQLAAEAAGERVMDFHQNLVMLAGAAPTNSYRTVDLPFANQLPDPMVPTDRRAWFERVNDRSDVRWEVWDVEPPALAARPPGQGEFAQAVADRTLAEILHGRRFVEQFGTRAAMFQLRSRGEASASRAWYWDARVQPERFRDLIAAPRSSSSAELTDHWLYRSPAVAATVEHTGATSLHGDVQAAGPGMLILSMLAYPGWEATIVRPDGSREPAELMGQAGCALLPIREAGRIGVELAYRSEAFERGRSVSLFSAGFWVIALLLVRPRRPLRNASERAR